MISVLPRGLPTSSQETWTAQHTKTDIESDIFDEIEYLSYLAIYSSGQMATEYLQFRNVQLINPFKLLRVLL